MTAQALILNVDDNDTNRYVKTRVLQRAGYPVVEAATGADALRLIRERGPALVLLDVKLPDMNGRSICAELKSHAATASIVVLQTSASHVESRHRVASLEAGADGYLVEPMEPEELVANVKALLRMRQAEDERQAALAELREADRRKDEFLAMLAHELRNPLAPIRNAVEILKTEDPAIRERARTLIGRQVTHLARLVDDLLEVSRITQGKVALQTKPTRLADVVQVAAETAMPYVQSRGHELAIRVDPRDLWLEADPDRLAQVVSNLLHNAAKFTPWGGRLALTAGEADGALEIAVEDNGLGIAPDVLPKVFDLFTQGAQSLDRAQGGLGIGLSLVKGLVEMHGGTVTAESRGEGQGSCFRVRLPLSLLRAAPPRDASAPAVAVAHRRRRILLVEDNPDAADAMQMLLHSMGHEVTVLNDGGEALRVARDVRPDLIMLDIGLPGVDGYQLARQLREAPETRGAQLVAVTGYGQAKDRERSREAGFDMHLVKPVDPERLTEVVGLA